MERDRPFIQTDSWENTENNTRTAGQIDSQTDRRREKVQQIHKQREEHLHYIYICIYILGRRFYPKQLTMYI